MHASQKHGEYATLGAEKTWESTPVAVEASGHAADLNQAVACAPTGDLQTQQIACLLLQHPFQMRGSSKLQWVGDPAPISTASLGWEPASRKECSSLVLLEQEH